MTLRWLLAFLITTPMLLAEVYIDSSLTDVYRRGTNELSGAITITVLGNEFSRASAKQPLFMRISFSANTGLAETLVDLSSGDPSINRPIYLALRHDGLQEVSMNATPDAVSIVRWVAGEPDIWIRIQESSDTWLLEGIPRGPDKENEVGWTMGISARISDNTHTLNASWNASNLPFNTRDVTASEGDFHLATSTNFCLDFSASNIKAELDHESVLDFDIVIFDEKADMGNGIYSDLSANNLGVGFVNDFVTARSKNRSCELQEIVIEEGQTSTGDLFTHTRTIRLDHQCLRGGPYLTTQMGTGSIVYISSNSTGFGIPENGARFTVAGKEAGFMQGVQSSIIQIGGVALFTEAELIWTDTTYDFRQNDLSLEFDIQYDPNQIPTVEMGFSVTVTNHDGSLDEAPYDGEHQKRRCDGSYLPIPGQTVDIDPAAYQPFLSQWPNTLNLIDLMAFLPSTR